MVQRKFYLPEQMYNSLQLRAKVMRKTITQVLRDLIDEGLRNSAIADTGRGTKALIGLAKMAEKNKWHGPADLAKKHDNYFASAKTKANKPSR